MNRQQAKELLPIIQAYAEGKTIQIKAIDGIWYDDEDMVKFDSSPQNYRIKPESKYRPFANAEECWAEMQKHQPFGWVKRIKDTESKAYIYCGAITKVDGVLTSIDELPFSYDDMYSTYKFVDGIPFGIEE